MLHNRKALAWLMVALLVLAGCSSTPRVVETKPNPTVVTPEIRAQIEADPEVQTLILLAKNEGKGLDWTKATQSADSNDSLVVQVPIYIRIYKPPYPNQALQLCLEHEPPCLPIGRP
ncbi:putative uncharacterized protein [Meiothermus ruber H328]|nr:putative uncharacterized protein [Meiothermus ruber H328]